MNKRQNRFIGDTKIAAHNRRRKRFDMIVLTAWFSVFVLGAAFWVGFMYAAIHFIQKYW